MAVGGGCRDGVGDGGVNWRRAQRARQGQGRQPENRNFVESHFNNTKASDAYTHTHTHAPNASQLGARSAEPNFGGG